MKKFLKYGYSCHNVEQAISVGKMALKDLLDARLPQTFICKKKKTKSKTTKQQYLQSTMKLSAVKPGLPVLG